MNERIKQLTEQANAWYPDGYPSSEGGDAAWRNLVIFEKQDLQKFAQLIVKECANIADQEAKEQKNNHGKQAADRIWNTIMNRFRVEE